MGFTSPLTSGRSLLHYFLPSLLSIGSVAVLISAADAAAVMGFVDRSHAHRHTSGIDK